MVINFIVNPVFDGWSPWDKRLGGSEECVVQWSWRLAGRGNEVAVYHNGNHGEYRGVQYLERSEYINRRPGITVNVNYPDLSCQEPTVYWTSLYPETGRDLSAFKEVLALSEWHRSNSGIKHNNISILPPGYNSGHIRPGIKIPKTVLYASSPDRGLKNLLKVWPEVVAAHPDAQLLVTYGADGVDLPNLINLGEVSEEEMNQLFQESDIWCHPCDGNELYCMSGIKAQAAGCWPVYFPHMALRETVRYGTPATPENLSERLISALAGHPKPPLLLYPDWDSTTAQLELILKKWYNREN